MSRMTRLVLRRMKDESVILTLPDGRQVTITVVGANRESGILRLRFDAPSDIVINRSEIEGNDRRTPETQEST